MRTVKSSLIMTVFFVIAGMGFPANSDGGGNGGGGGSDTVVVQPPQGFTPSQVQVHIEVRLVDVGATVERQVGWVPNIAITDAPALIEQPVKAEADAPGQTGNSPEKAAEAAQLLSSEEIAEALRVLGLTMEEAKAFLFFLFFPRGGSSSPPTPPPQNNDFGA